MERVSAARGYCTEYAYCRGTVALTLRCVVFSFPLSELFHASSSLLPISLFPLPLTQMQMHNLSSRDYVKHHLVFLREVELIISLNISPLPSSHLSSISLPTSPLFFSLYNTSTLSSFLNRNSMDNLCMHNRAHTSLVAALLWHVIIAIGRVYRECTLPYIRLNTVYLLNFVRCVYSSLSTVETDPGSCILSTLTVHRYDKARSESVCRSA